MQELNNLFIFLDTQQLGNMYFGNPSEIPMNAVLKLRNDSEEIINELNISIEVIDIKSKAKLFFEEFALTDLVSRHDSCCAVDFSKIQIYGTFDVVIKAKSEAKEAVYQTKMARVPIAERQIDFLGVNTHVSMRTEDLQRIDAQWSPERPLPTAQYP